MVPERTLHLADHDVLSHGVLIEAAVHTSKAPQLEVVGASSFSATVTSRFGLVVPVTGQQRGAITMSALADNST